MMPCTFMWDGPIAIFDEISRSGTGEIELTLAGFDAWKVIRTAGFCACPVPDSLSVRNAADRTGWGWQDSRGKAAAKCGRWSYGGR